MEKECTRVFLSAGGNKAYCVSKGLKEVRSEVYPDLSGAAPYGGGKVHSATTAK